MPCLPGRVPVLARLNPDRLRGGGVRGGSAEPQRVGKIRTEEPRLPECLFYQRSRLRELSSGVRSLGGLLGGSIHLGVLGNATCRTRVSSVMHRKEGAKQERSAVLALSSVSACSECWSSFLLCPLVCLKLNWVNEGCQT